MNTKAPNGANQRLLQRTDATNAIDAEEEAKAQDKFALGGNEEMKEIGITNNRHTVQQDHQQRRQVNYRGAQKIAKQ